MTMNKLITGCKCWPRQAAVSSIGMPSHRVASTLQLNWPAIRCTTRPTPLSFWPLELLTQAISPHCGHMRGTACYSLPSHRFLFHCSPSSRSRSCLTCCGGFKPNFSARLHLSKRLMPAQGPKRGSRSNCLNTRSSSLTSASETASMPLTPGSSSCSFGPLLALVLR